jgi:thiaminase/transcriptional activator TenA
MTATSWTASLWVRTEDIYQAILDHPFLRGLTDGTLDEDRFAYYVAQDAHYLRDFARALALVGVKAPTHADTAMFADHAAATAKVELALHHTLMPQLGLDPDRLAEIVVSPTTTAYTSFLLNVAYSGTFAEAMAAVLPCYWIYQRVGDALIDRGSPDKRYQMWIDTYAGEEFAASVAAVLALGDEVGPRLTAAEKQTATGHFVTSARYEWMFWDAAWRRESWPV